MAGCKPNGAASEEENQWERKLGNHLYGQFSMALVRAKVKSKNRCQLVSGPLSNVPNGPTGVFVGIYDSHGGDLCSQFFRANLLSHLKAVITNQHGVVNPNAILEAYYRTENKFMEQTNWEQKLKMASSGSSCLFGVMHGNVLYVANAGDSHAVLARCTDGDEQPVAHLLSIEHNAADHGSYPVRGRLEMTRAIGDVKFNELNRPPLEARYRQQQPIVRPILKSELAVQAYQLIPGDKFVIFASDGLWGEVLNVEAVSIVKASPRSGAAGALLKEALGKGGSRTNNVQYQKLIDGISIVVLFFDHLTNQSRKIENGDSKGHAKGLSSLSKKSGSHCFTAPPLRMLHGKTGVQALMLLDQDNVFDEAGDDEEAHEEEQIAQAWQAFTDGGGFVSE
ncbi:hypothetical protein LUZ62_041145 [Rhynchospora pubera]|uniref:protein-serine/threonine phosphatase n=1 Tax=Rhynchospora pubera TaxID=906938 RepID=A0AAV8FA71_9POAL|nr:hypothetical protein LUZ62_041145 [Rhynchospora pubera]